MERQTEPSDGRRRVSGRVSMRGDADRQSFQASNSSRLLRLRRHRKSPERARRLQTDAHMLCLYDQKINELGRRQSGTRPRRRLRQEVFVRLLRDLHERLNRPHNTIISQSDPRLDAQQCRFTRSRKCDRHSK